MAVAALLLWLGTAAVGGYLLATAVQRGNTARSGDAVHPGTTGPAPDEPAPAGPPAAGAGLAAAFGARGPERPVRARDRFDPPSLQRAKSEPAPGLRELAEFAHPALAMIGAGFWIGYVVSRDRVFAVIGLGVLLGAICAGLSWFTANTRAARRAASPEGEPGVEGEPGAGSSTRGRDRAPLSASPRLLILHAAGAALTLLFAVLIAVRA